MTHFAIAVLEQLRFGNVWDGNLVSKRGRTELIELGLAQRNAQGMNALTHKGQQRSYLLARGNETRH